MAGKEAPFIRFLKMFVIDEKTGCWVWEKQISNAGYGKIKAFGKMVDAHRFSYELYKGRIPNNLHILHSCDNKKCVNPDHLAAGTQAENMRQAAQRGLMPKGNKHHAFGKPSPRKGIKSNQAKAVIVLGKAFGSINEAERELSLGSGTVNYWIKSNPSKAKIITKTEYYQYA